MAGELTLEEQREVAQEEVSQLQEELNTLVAELDEMQRQLISIGEQMIQRGQDLEGAKEDKQRQYDDMMLRIVYIYEAGNVSALERILTSGSIAEMLVQVELVQRIHNYDRELLARFVETIEHIDELKGSLEEDFASLEYKQGTYKEQVEHLRNIIETRSADIEDIDRMIEEAIRFAAAMAAEAEEAMMAENNDSPMIGEAPSTSAEESQETSLVDNSPATPPSGDDVPPFVPPGDATAAQIIVAAAHSAIGVPYEWGGSTMAGFDCSGLTQWAHTQAGIIIPRTDITQRNAGRPVPMGQQQPGDIAWTWGHVGLYIGNGMMIEAQQPGTNVMISSVRADVFVRFW